MRTDLVDSKFEHIFSLTPMFQRAVAEHVAIKLNTALASQVPELEEIPFESSHVALKEFYDGSDKGYLTGYMYEEPALKYDLKIGKALLKELSFAVSGAVRGVSERCAEFPLLYSVNYFKNGYERLDVVMSESHHFAVVSIPESKGVYPQNTQYWDDLTKDAISYFVNPEYV